MSQTSPFLRLASGVIQEKEFLLPSRSHCSLGKLVLALQGVSRAICLTPTLIASIPRGICHPMSTLSPARDLKCPINVFQATRILMPLISSCQELVPLAICLTLLTFSLSHCIVDPSYVRGIKISRSFSIKFKF